MRKVKTPSVDAAKLLLLVKTPEDLPPKLRKKYGKPEVFALFQSPDVRKFFSFLVRSAGNK